MMKMNKWTMALAAAGVVSLSSVAQAQEAATGAEALAASTTVSGYVSTSYTSTSDAHGQTFRSNSDIDQFALDVVSLSISNGDLGAEAGSAAYNLELWIGPAADDIGTEDSGTTAGTVELMEANIELLASLGEQDVKLTVGQFATTVGAETYSYADNTFHSRSFGFAIEPTHHTGIKADTNLGGFDVTLGLVNDTTSANVDATNGGSTTLISGLSYTLGSGTGWLEGTELTYGGVHEAGTDAAEVDNYYFGLTKEILTDLTYSVAWDIREDDARADSNVVGHYLSYPLGGGTLNVRYEHGNINTSGLNADGLEALTLGYNYPIWTGVTSRVEFRSDDWDGKTNGSTESVALNLVYNF